LKKLLILSLFLGLVSCGKNNSESNGGDGTCKRFQSKWTFPVNKSWIDLININFLKSGIVGGHTVINGTYVQECFWEFQHISGGEDEGTFKLTYVGGAELICGSVFKYDIVISYTKNCNELVLDSDETPDYPITLK
jgi:hypothetical protein